MFTENQGQQKCRSKAHAGKVGAGVLTSIAVKQRVWIVDCTHLTRPLAWWALIHTTKSTGSATRGRIGILADVANVTAQF